MVDGRAGRKRPRRVADAGADSAAQGATKSTQQREEHHAFEVRLAPCMRLHAELKAS